MVASSTRMIFRDKGYAVDQLNIRPSFKDDRTDNMDTTGGSDPWMPSPPAYELCMAQTRNTFPEYVEHFKHSKLTADFGQEGGQGATRIIRRCETW